jgi:hypothetical protein
VSVDCDYGVGAVEELAADLEDVAGVLGGGDCG